MADRTPQERLMRIKSESFELQPLSDEDRRWLIETADSVYPPGEAHEVSAAMTLTEYRQFVRSVECPASGCNATPGEPCSSLDSHAVVDYVHDDRSLALHEALKTTPRS